MALLVSVVLVAKDSRWDYYLYVFVAMLLPLGGVVLHWYGWTSGVAAFTVFVTMSAVAVVVESWELYSPPTHLEPAQVWLSKHSPDVSQPIDGFLLTETGSSVYLAERDPDPDVCRVTGNVFVFRRDDVDRLSVVRSVHVYPTRSDDDKAKQPCK